MIKTKYGNIEGVIENNCKLYKGIPFAKPPVGDLRFKAPQEVELWDGIYLADKFPNAPMQTPAPSDDFYGKEFNSDINPQYSEDCLYLNIWTPMEAKEGDNLPVAVWFYGGGLVSGYSAEKEFDGTEYAKRGVILITANYRVGLFGFMCHPWLAEENNGRCGNHGCLDELAALQWVKENIVHFGGNPSNITLFGQSSGALTSQTLVISPLTQNLVSKCIMQSGAGYENGFGKNGSQEDFYDLGEKAVELLEVHSIEELRNVSAEKVLEVSDQLIGWYLEQGKGMGYEPVIDGYFLIGDSEENQRNGNYLDIPYILGSTANDICTPEGETVPKEDSQLHQGCVKWCEHQIELGKIPSYVYYFKRRLPGDNSGAFHSADLWYTFGTLKRCWRPFTELDYKLSSEIIDYWTNFMKYGDPNGLGLCKWNPWDNYNNEIKIFDI